MAGDDGRGRWRRWLCNNKNEPGIGRAPHLDGYVSGNLPVSAHTVVRVDGVVAVSIWGEVALHNARVAVLLYFPPLRQINLAVDMVHGEGILPGAFANTFVIQSSR